MPVYGSPEGIPLQLSAKSQRFCQLPLYLAPWKKLNVILLSNQTVQHEIVDEVAAGTDQMNEVDTGPDAIDEVNAARISEMKFAKLFSSTLHRALCKDFL